MIVEHIACFCNIYSLINSRTKGSHQGELNQFISGLKAFCIYGLGSLPLLFQKWLQTIKDLSPPLRAWIGSNWQCWSKCFGVSGAHMQWWAHLKVVINSDGVNYGVDCLFPWVFNLLACCSILGVKIELGMGLVFLPRRPKIMYPWFHHVLTTPHLILFFSFMVWIIIVKFVPHIGLWLLAFQ